MRKTQILTNKPVYLGLLILDASNTAIYEFWYDYLKPKYGEKSNFCYIDTACFIVKKQKIFTKILQNMFKQDLTLQILKQRDHYLKVKIKK